MRPSRGRWAAIRHPTPTRSPYSLLRTWPARCWVSPPECLGRCCCCCWWWYCFLSVCVSITRDNNIIIWFIYAIKLFPQVLYLCSLFRLFLNLYFFVLYSVRFFSLFWLCLTVLYLYSFVSFFHLLSSLPIIPVPSSSHLLYPTVNAQKMPFDLFLFSFFLSN